MEQRAVDLETVFTTLPGNNVLLLPDAPKFTIVAVSDDYLQSTGRSREELMHKGLFEVFPNNPEDPALTSEKTVRASLEYALLHKERHDLPVQRYDMLTKEGHFNERYWATQNKPILKEDGEVVYLVHNIEDVTEKIKAPEREARQKIQESEEKYHTLFNSIDQGMCIIELVYDENGRPVDHLFVETNPVYEQQTGLKNAAGKTARQLVPGLELNWSERYHEVAVTGKPVRFTKRSEALKRWFDIYAFPLGDREHRRIAILFSDITDKKKAEEMLQRSEERLQKVLSIETVGVIYFDLEGRITDANSAFQRMSGFIHEDIINGKLRWDEVTPPEFMAITLRSREELLIKGENTPYEKQYIRPDGSRWWGLFAGKRLSDTECVEYVIDITDRKMASELLELRVAERTKELEIRNRELEQFTYVSHHDLQEPLRKIIMFTDMVKTDSYEKLSEASQNRMDRVIDASRRMSVALKDVLNFASLNKEEQYREVDLEEILAAVQLDLELVISEKNARIQYDALPRINAITGQMHQLFYNLLNNALKFSKPDIAPLLRISCEEAPPALKQFPDMQEDLTYYHITMLDNGIGFPQESSDKIFGMFQRLHNKESFAGTGIGLALCKKIVENHNGFIWAESKPGEGAAFHVLLPAA